VYTALRATSRTLADFLTGRFESDPDLGTLFPATMTVSLNTPEGMHESNALGLSIWLYRVVRDDQQFNAPPRRIDINTIQPPPLPLRLHYLLTPIADVTAPTGAMTEQVILGKALQAFRDHSIMSGADLRDDFVGTEIELNVRLEPLDLAELYQIWDALDMSYRLSVSYEVSIVNIDAATQSSSVSPVLQVNPAYVVIV
jgi:hypothetical protein